jgi:hypothetical protein
LQPFSLEESKKKKNYIGVRIQERGGWRLDVRACAQKMKAFGVIQNGFQLCKLHEKDL